jgi:hypothetical protein
MLIINDLQKQHSFGITFSHNKFKDIHHCSLMFRAVEMQQWSHPITADDLNLTWREFGRLICGRAGWVLEIHGLQLAPGRARTA